jgi:FdhE protein
MSGFALSDRSVKTSLNALERRAREILKSRPAYREMVDFYLTVFRCQINCRERLRVHPQTVDEHQRQLCLQQGVPLIEQYDPGIEPASLLEIWTEMKAVFRRGNPVLRHAVDQIDEAEAAGAFAPAAWLVEQRPDRTELVANASQRIGIEQSVLATLTRAVTFPHWDVVAQSWLSQDHLDGWQRPHCPVCGTPPALAEVRCERSGSEDLAPVRRRLMYCPFCGAGWAVSALTCPNCDSSRAGDARYYYTREEPDLRLDFCKRCDHYIKVVIADKINGRLHVGLEALTTTHLDQIAEEKNLKPLETCS